MKTTLIKLLSLGLVFSLGIAGLAVLFAVPVTSSAQGANVLLNPNFDLSATPRGNINGLVPINWEVWRAGVVFNSDIDPFFSHVRSDPYSWVLKNEYQGFTGGGYQVATVEAGLTYQFTMHTYIWTCNDGVNSCIRSDGTYSDTSSGGQVRVGIDPTGGTDPNSGNIIWSAYIAPHPLIPPNSKATFSPVSVIVEATGPQMTVFTWFTASASMRFQEVYFEDASLVATGGTPTGTSGGAAAATAEPVQQFVPFVVKQQPRPDGSLVHVVVAGDTIDSIAFAYRDLGVTKEDILQLNGWEFPPRIISIGQEILILPAGSIDPATGELLSGGSASTGNQPQATPAAGGDGATGSTTGGESGTPAPQVGPTIQPTVTPVPRMPMQAISDFLPTGSIKY